MKLVLTLLCRDEADVLPEWLAFHYAAGVDLVIATDNGSCDSSVAILEREQRRGRLQLIHEPEHCHDQARWVSHMARLAWHEHRADWVLPSDADEFWWTPGGKLKAELARQPGGVQALSVPRHNFLPPQPAPGLVAHRSSRRQIEATNALGQPLPAKVCHRGHPDPWVSDGNHAVQLDGVVVPASAAAAIEILHLPVRSYTQLERKILQGAQALERNQRIGPEVGNTWRYLYREHYLRGTLPDYYQAFCQQPALEDHRLAEALAAALPLP